MAEVKIDSPYLTADEAAAYLRYPNAHSFRIDIPKKGIPHLRRGRKFFFTKQQLDEFMQVSVKVTMAAGRPRNKKRVA